MVLVDTSVWIQHLRADDARLDDLLMTGRVVVHPFVIGELALGNLRERRRIIDDLSNLRQATIASDEEVLTLIENESLAGSGIGYVDAHLLASARLTPGTTLWSYDKRLDAVARKLVLSS